MTTPSRRGFLVKAGSATVLGGACAVTANIHPRATTTQPRQPVAKPFQLRTRQPRRIATSGNYVYVAGGREIEVHSLHGEFIRTLPMPKSPRCLAVDGGRLLVGMKEQLHVYSLQGALLEEWQTPGAGALLSGIAVAGSTVFVSDAGHRVVRRYDKQGQLLGEINPGGFIAPAEFFTVAASDDGMVHVANPGRHRIERYTAAGEFVSSWGGHSRQLDGFAGCCNPISFALTPGGGYVTAERGAPRIKRFTADGKLQQLLAGPESFAENAAASVRDNTTGCNTGGFDVAVTSRRQLLLLDRVTAKISVYGV